MTVKITQTVSWLNHCYPHGDMHEHVAVYLVHEGDAYILVDSGSFYHRTDVLASVGEATAEQGPDAIILSHSDYPHAGNIDPLGGDTADVELVASSGAPEMQGLPDARRCRIGGQLSVKGREFSFIDPPLADRSHTTWIYDHHDGVLFTADGFGAYHAPDACTATSRDRQNGISLDAVRDYHRDNLVWLRYVEPTKLRQKIDGIFEEYDVDVIAPVHGPPIVGADIDHYLETVYDAVGQITGEYTVET